MWRKETSLLVVIESTCELPHTDLRYSVGFPIQRALPPRLRSPFGLTYPPRAGVLVPKTQIFAWTHTC
jgi:hypothetical protein